MPRSHSDTAAAPQPVHVQLTATNHDWRRDGRAIRRLVTLADNVRNLIDEALRRGSQPSTNIESSVEQDRRFKAYTQLVTSLPRFGEWISGPDTDSNELDVIVKMLTEGAESARADDTSKLKHRVVLWLMELDPSTPPLPRQDKVDRGFHSDATGRLLCPVDYDWDDEDHRDKIREWHPHYLVTADMWPQYLYEDGKYNPNNPTEGLFMGNILVKAFKSMFTSPSSAEGDVETGADSFGHRSRRRGERRTRSHVASLVQMNSVVPRAIAYTAVQVRFALSDCGSWRLEDDLFNYHDFYNSIVSWFEDTDNPADEQFINNLLLWWNRKIFGRAGVLKYAPPGSQRSANSSVAASFKRSRCVRDDDVPV